MYPSEHLFGVAGNMSPPTKPVQPARNPSGSALRKALKEGGLSRESDHVFVPIEEYLEGMHPFPSLPEAGLRNFILYNYIAAVNLTLQVADRVLASESEDLVKRAQPGIAGLRDRLHRAEGLVRREQPQATGR